MSNDENLAKFFHDCAGNFHQLDAFFEVLLNHPGAITKEMITGVRTKLKSAIKDFRRWQSDFLHREGIFAGPQTKEEANYASGRIFEDFVDERKAEIKTSLNCWSRNIPKLAVEKTELRSILNTLYDNALDAQKGYHNISCQLILSPGPNYLRFKFRDFGKGISPDKIPKIFDKGYTTKSHGTGYGLYYVRKLLETVGGGISVVSDQGKGTTFMVTIPYLSSHG
jgi:signal transduction histidine kinase